MRCFKCHHIMKIKGDEYLCPECGVVSKKTDMEDEEDDHNKSDDNIKNNDSRINDVIIPESKISGFELFLVGPLEVLFTVFDSLLIMIVFSFVVLRWFEFENTFSYKYLPYFIKLLINFAKIAFVLFFNLLLLKRIFYRMEGREINLKTIFRWEGIKRGFKILTFLLIINSLPYLVIFRVVKYISENHSGLFELLSFALVTIVVSVFLMFVNFAIIEFEGPLSACFSYTVRLLKGYKTKLLIFSCIIVFIISFMLFTFIDSAASFFMTAEEVKRIESFIKISSVLVGYLMLVLYLGSYNQIKNHKYLDFISKPTAPSINKEDYMGRKRLLSSLILAFIIFIVYLLPNYYFRWVDSDIVQKKIEMKLKKKYNMPFTVEMERIITADAHGVHGENKGVHAAYIAPRKYDVTDPYYRRLATVYTLPFGIIGPVREDWEEVKYRLEREEFFLEKAQELLGVNDILLKEDSGFWKNGNYNANPRIGRDKLINFKANQEEHFDLHLEFFLFKTLYTEEEIRNSKQNIYKFLECLKEKNLFEYAHINIYYIDPRVLAPSYELYLRNISGIWRVDDNSVVYSPSEREKIIVSQELQSELLEQGEVKTREKINALTNKDLNYLRGSCQYWAEIITIKELKRACETTHENEIRYKALEKEDRLDEHIYDHWTKVKLVKNDLYLFIKGT